MRACHPDPASLAGEGSAVRKKAREKADSSPRQKPNGTTCFRVFPQSAAVMIESWACLGLEVNT